MKRRKDALKLDVEYIKRELIRPNQFNKLNREERNTYEEIKFPWGKAQTEVKGYKLK